MRPSSQHLATLATSVLVLSPALAKPIPGDLNYDPKRTANIGGAAEGILSMINRIIDITTTGTAAYDYQAQVQMCSVWFEAHFDPFCNVRVTCQEGGEIKYKAENCKPEATENFDDPRIGPFQITWGKGGGEPSEVLLNPILNVMYVDNDKPWDIVGISNENDQVCRTDYGENSWGDHTWTAWECGVPRIGQEGNDIDSNGPTNDDGWRPGWCGVHITQHQKPDPSKDNYKFDVYVKDANGGEVGKETGIDLAMDQLWAVKSKLPEMFTIKAGAEDKDTLWMFYGQDEWTIRDAEQKCNFGQFDSGKREGDCGFTCNGPAPPA